MKRLNELQRDTVKERRFMITLHCSECESFIEVTKHTVYREGGELYVECSQCGYKEEVQ